MESTGTRCRLFLDGSNIRFQTPPVIIQGSTAVTRIEYLIGYTSVPVRKLDHLTVAVDNQDQKVYSLTLGGAPYIPLSTISCLVAVDGVVKTPFSDYTIYEDKIILKQALSLGTVLSVRAVELIAPEFGKAASAISKIENGQLKDIIVKNGGSGYRINFTPKTTILTPADTTGENATAEATCQWY